MAVNVHMTLFRKCNAQQQKSLGWRYHLICYGCPFIVAFVYIFVDTEARGSIYGPATLWCLIDINWVALRIAGCYAPAWCCILLSFCIYALSGRKIFVKRQQLRAFNRACIEIPPVENSFKSLKNTEIRVTSELATLKSPDLARLFLSPDQQIGRQGATPSPSSNYHDPYTLTTGSRPTGPRGAQMTPTSPKEKLIGPSGGSKMELSPSAKSSLQQRKNRDALEANAAALGYTKVALLFFVSLLITWVSVHIHSFLFKFRSRAMIDAKLIEQVPSSVNRVYSLIYPFSSTPI